MHLYRAIRLPLKAFQSALLCIAAMLTLAPAARAGLTVDIHVYRSTYGYFFYPYLNSNTNIPTAPLGDYLIASPQYPTNGSSLQYESTPTNFYEVTGGGNYYFGAASLVDALTNGAWSIFVTNSGTTKVYQFQVSVAQFSSNTLTPLTITFPLRDGFSATTEPNITWLGPSNWAGTIYIQDTFTDTNGSTDYEFSQYLASDQTNLMSPVLPQGTNSLYMQYQSNATPFIVASTPVDGSAHPISSWTSTATLETYDSLNFIVRLPGAGTIGHTNVAHWTFDDNTIYTADTSGHGNSIGSSASSGGSAYITNDAAAGPFAAGFTYDYMFGASWLVPPTNLVSTLAGSFSIALWMKSSDVFANDDDDADQGEGLVAGNFGGGGAENVIPMSMTGSKLAFLTGGSTSDTLHSAASINTGHYVHLVVTRDQLSGEKKIYVNGVLDASDFATTDVLNGPTEMDIGEVSFHGFNGLLDDIQVYAGVLSATDVSFLYTNVGMTVPDAVGRGPVAYYDFDESTVVAPDVSGNGNNMVAAGNFGGSGPQIDNDAVAGPGSVSFDGNSFLSTPTNLLATLAGDFSLSLWVKTTQNIGDSSTSSPFLGGGAGIVSADVSGLANDLVPVALTGGKIGFNTGGNNDDTLYSQGTVNDDAWHHVVVTRDQATGDKQIFIDGVLDTAGAGTTNFLNDPQLLTIGAVADASQSDPMSPSFTGYQGYEGQIDDLQIYDSVVSTNDVAFLYKNPGQTLGAVAVHHPQPQPVSVAIKLDIQRGQDPTFGDIYICFPSFESFGPGPVVSNRVVSPNQAFGGSQDNVTGGGSSSYILSSLGDLLNDLTNGLWTMYIDEGTVTQQVYTFSVSISGLNTNLLTPVIIHSPADGSTAVPVNPPFFWSGPTNFATVSVNIQGGALDLTTNFNDLATNWPSPPTLSPGTNRFYVEYDITNLPSVMFSTPLDVHSVPISNWVTSVTIKSTGASQFVVSSGPSSVRLLSVQRTGTNIQFQFLSQSGFTNTVESRTNLHVGSWQSRGDFIGDGTVQTLQFPATNRPAEFFRIRTH